MLRNSGSLSTSLCSIMGGSDVPVFFLFYTSFLMSLFVLKMSTRVKSLISVHFLHFSRVNDVSNDIFSVSNTSKYSKCVLNAIPFYGGVLPCLKVSIKAILTIPLYYFPLSKCVQKCH